jgi:hypothetical protein
VGEKCRNETGSARNKNAHHRWGVGYSGLALDGGQLSRLHMANTIRLGHWKAYGKCSNIKVKIKNENQINEMKPMAKIVEPEINNADEHKDESTKRVARKWRRSMLIERIKSCVPPGSEYE